MDKTTLREVFSENCIPSPNQSQCQQHTLTLQLGYLYEQFRKVTENIFRSPGREVIANKQHFANSSTPVNFVIFYKSLLP